MQISGIQGSLNKDITGYKKENKNPNFKGVGSACLGAAGKFFQICDDIPMIGVSFTDTVATNVPRTVVDLKQTGVPAAAETARREFSGIFVNCLIPGAFVYGAARVANDSSMRNYLQPTGKPINMARTWMNGEAIENLITVWKRYAGIEKDATELIKESHGEIKEVVLKKQFNGREFVKGALSSLEGLKGVDNWERLSDHKALIDEASELISSTMVDTPPKNLFRRLAFRRDKSEKFQQAFDVLVHGKYTYRDSLGKKVVKVVEEGGGFGASQTLKFDGKSIGSDLKNFLRDASDMGIILGKSKEARLNPDEFMRKAKSFVNGKSLAGLAMVIPLAMSMQYINRAITRRKYQKAGAPIYKDFEQTNRILTEDEKNKLKKTKPLAVASIVGLAALSMGKTFPTSPKAAIDMLQFNTKFPSLNQCRLIATSTFASRMLASEDPNELRESTVRDLASFAGLYFLGDYAEKLAATAIQKFSKPGKSGELQMFNKLKQPSEYKNGFQRFVGWVKDTNIKSFDEIPEQFKNYRSLAKLGGLGFSIALLGIGLPMYNKHVTNKKEARRKAILEQQKKQNNIYDPKSIFPHKEIKVEPEVKIDPLEESKRNFTMWNGFINDNNFSKIASQFIK